MKLQNIQMVDNLFTKDVNDPDERLANQLKNKRIEGEQWFRDFSRWLIIAFNNPYNYKYSNSELLILENNKNKILPLIKNHLQIHYGVGVGETELVLARWQLEAEDYLEIVGIDVNQTFLDLFIQNLRDKQLEFPRATILSKCYNSTFQKVGSTDLHFENRASDKTVHICLGGTIGNFSSQKEIFDIFSRNMQKNDKLLLGVQLDNQIDIAFAKYQNNAYFPDFILNYHKKAVNPKKITWKLDRIHSTITAEYYDIEIFRTKKYNFDNLTKELGAMDLKPIGKWFDSYENSCIAIFEKVT